MLRLNSFLFLIFFGLASVGAGAEEFDPGAHCVAYKVEKVVFFFSKSPVIGRNCDISAQVLPEVGGLYHIEVVIPVRSFNSGDTDRDKDVAVILKSDQKPEMTFKSKAMTAEQWKALFAKGDFDISGELSIGNKSYPLTLHSKYSGKEDMAEVDGTGRVRFEDFELSPPKVVGGVVAKAKPDIELHFHLLSSRILGADSIRLGSVER
jgi:polyisoprenoid-binding protein YceI